LRKLFLIAIVLFVSFQDAQATFIPLTVRELDGSPSITKVKTISVNGATLSDLNNGHVLMTISGGASGAAGAVQFNNSGALAGSSSFTWDGTQLVLPQATITAPTASTIPLTVKGAASQTANLQEWQNSTGTVMASVGNTGVIQATTVFVTGGNVQTHGGNEYGMRSAPYAWYHASEAAIKAVSTGAFGNARTVIRGNGGLSLRTLDELSDAPLTAGAITASSTTRTAVTLNSIANTAWDGAASLDIIQPGSITTLWRPLRTGASFYIDVNPAGAATLNINGGIGDSFNVLGGTMRAPASDLICKAIAANGTGAFRNNLSVAPSTNTDIGINLNPNTGSLRPMIDLTGNGYRNISFGMNSNWDAEICSGHDGINPQQLVLKVGTRYGSPITGLTLTPTGDTRLGTSSTNQVLRLGREGRITTLIGPSVNTEVDFLSFDYGYFNNLIMGGTGVGQFYMRATNGLTVQNTSGSGLGPIEAGSITASGTSPSTVVLTAKAAASQTANILEAQNSAGTALAVINNGGNLGVGIANPVRKLHISQAMRLEPQSSPPASPVLGDLYVDSDSNELCFFNGTVWTGMVAGGACS